MISGLIYNTSAENNEVAIKKKKCSICKGYIKWEFGESIPEKCPHCSTVKWYRKPMESRLFTLQEKYFESNRDQYWLGEMYKILNKYAKNSISYRTNGGKRLDIDTVERKAQDASTVLITYYLLNPEFKIHSTFSTYIIGAVNYQLYYRKFQQMDKVEISTETPLGNSINNKQSTIGDMISDIKYSESDYIEKNKETYLLNEFEVIITKIIDRMTDQYGSEISSQALILFHHFLNGKNSQFINKYIDRFGIEVEKCYENLRLMLFKLMKLNN